MDTVKDVTVYPTPFVKPHCVLIVADATVLLIKKALSTYRCPLAKICKHVLCFLYICMDELLRKNMSDALDFDVTSSNILALS